MKEIDNRIQRLERASALAIVRKGPSILAQRRERRLREIEMGLMHNDPKAMDAAWCMAEALAALLEANPDWPGRDMATIVEIAVKADPKVRAAGEYLATVHQKALAAMAI